MKLVTIAQEAKLKADETRAKQDKLA